MKEPSEDSSEDLSFQSDDCSRQLDNQQPSDYSLGEFDVKKDAQTADKSTLEKQFSFGLTEEHSQDVGHRSLHLSRSELLVHEIEKLEQQKLQLIRDHQRVQKQAEKDTEFYRKLQSDQVKKDAEHQRQKTKLLQRIKALEHTLTDSKNNVDEAQSKLDLILGSKYIGIKAKKLLARHSDSPMQQKMMKKQRKRA